MKAKGIKAIFAAILAVLLLTFSFTGCTQKEKIVIDTPTLQVVQQGAYTTIYDVEGGKEYQYKTVRVKKGEGSTEARASVSTDTIEIVLLPGGGFQITDHTAGKIYTVKRGL